MRPEYSKIKISIPKTCKDWFQYWLNVQYKMPSQSSLENETIRVMFDILTGKFEGDFIAFNNTPDRSFDIITGNTVKSILKDKYFDAYIYCYRLNGKDFIKKFHIWNRPRTYLSSIKVTKEDLNKGYIEFEEDKEHEAELWGDYVLKFPYTGLKNE